MSFITNFTSSLNSINEDSFVDIALQLFRFQAEQNPVYQKYINARNIDVAKVASLDQIPFLPISFFKTHAITTGTWNPEVEFSSSGTTGLITSRHAVKSLPFYLNNAEAIFNQFFGSIQDYHILALLPSYLEREGSSLIVMIDHFIKKSKSEHSGFYLYNQKELIQKLELLRSSEKKVILWGVSFALLDLAEKFELDLSHCIIVETGGMKGRRRELIREELHAFLCTRFNVQHIASEYGMTELLSQAYSKERGLYQLPKWMKVMVRDINDPTQILATEKIGCLNVIDLANAHSCAFIETHDLARIGQNGYLEVLGRMDNSDLRGCNLLVG